MKLVVTIPAFNEENTIAKVIEEIPKKIPGIGKIGVLVIDDGSSDSTSKIARSLGAFVIRNPMNRGLAFTFSRGLETALEMGADIVVNTDADFQYNQKQIPLLVSPILEGRADIVLGSRFLGTIESMPAGKYFGNRAMSAMVSFLTGLAISDSQTGFRAFSREAALKINVFSDYTYTQETILEAWEKNLQILEVPVEFRKRDGQSRLISNIFVYAKKAGFTVIEGYVSYKPFLVFMASGFAVMSVGALFGWRVLDHYIRTGLVSPYLPSAVLSSLLLILGAQLLIVGLIAEMVKRNRKIEEQLLYEAKKARTAK